MPLLQISRFSAKLLTSSELFTLLLQNILNNGEYFRLHLRTRSHAFFFFSTVRLACRFFLTEGEKNRGSFKGAKNEGDIFYECPILL